MKDINDLKNIDQKMRDSLWTLMQRHCQHCHREVYHLLKPRGIIHHIDCDRSNNNISNLLLLCRSCHSKLHNLYIYDIYSYMWEIELMTCAKCILPDNRLDDAYRFRHFRKEIALLERENNMLALPKRDLERLDYFKKIKEELSAKYNIS